MEKLNIGIVGLRFGSTVIEELKDSIGGNYFNVYAVCDIDKMKTDEMSLKYSAKPFYSIESLLNDPEVHVVGLFTPPANRTELIDKIISSGRDLITTKPFDLDAQRALKILNKANEMKRIIHVNSPGPVWHDTIRYIKEWQSKYNLGIPVGCRSDIWVSYREKADGSWYDDPIRCPVAPIFRLGIYIINDLVRLFGTADKVSVMSSRLITKRPTFDNSQLSILFKNGTITNVFASFCVDDTERYKKSMTLNFENGTIYYNSMHDEGSDMDLMKLVTRDILTGEKLVKEIKVKGNGGQYQWDEFYNSVLSRKVNDEIYINDIVEGLKVINAMIKSEHTGRIELV